jgi:uncharacterized protein YdaU (DUF1376 family)
MNYYPFHPGDYLRDTAHLQPMEDLAYRRLLDLYYESEAPIPTETQQVSRRLRLGSDVVEMVLNEFFICTEFGYTHKRCDAEIANYHARQERSRCNGKLGGRPKKTQQVILANPEVTQSKPRETQTKANHNHNHNHNIPSIGFQEFWQTYPRKIGKGAAQKAWDKLKPDLDTVLAALAWQTKQDAWIKDAGQYIPHPGTYLNQQRWLDEKPLDNAAVNRYNL